MTYTWSAAEAAAAIDRELAEWHAAMDPTPRLLLWWRRNPYRAARLLALTAGLADVAALLLA